MRALLIGLFVWAGLPALAQDPPSTGNITQDARLIITSEKGDVRIWSHAPRVLIYAPSAERPAIAAVIDTIEAAVASPFGPTLFSAVTYRDLPQNLGADETLLRIAGRRGGPAEIEMEVDLGDGKHTTDILIMVGNRRDVAVVNGLYGVSPQTTRPQMRGGQARCFYNTRSRKGVRVMAYVTIVPFADAAETEECYWEEILHALGPLQDAEDTPFFSFDDRGDWQLDLSPSEVAQRRANDMALIRALYESGVKPGDPPEVALDYFETLLDVR